MNLDHSDANLVALLKIGDANAFEAIYKRYAAILFNYARKNISSKEDCQEIIQEVFVSLWERHRVVKINSLNHYLFASIRYRIIRYFQHNKVKRKYAENYRLFEGMYETIEHLEETPEGLFKMLETVVEELPPRCRATVKLRMFENLPNQEIADRLNISKKTVEFYMSKAFNHIRSCRRIGGLN